MSKYVGGVAVVWALLASACSSGVDQTSADQQAAELDEEAAASDAAADVEVARALDTAASEAEFQRAVAAPLSAAQRRAIMDAFERTGVALTEDQFSGQMLRIDDGYLDLAPLLEQLAARGLIEPD